MLPYTLLGDFAKGGFAELKMVELQGRRRALLRRPLKFSLFHWGELSRFKKGLEVRALLTPHKNIVGSIEYEAAFLHPWELIEYVNGDNLKTYYNVKGNTLAANREYILDSCAAGIACVHSAGFMHLDVKPENFICQTSGKVSVKLTDFDLAKPADDNRPQAQMGTPVYMAPEQLHGKVSFKASDVFAFSVMAYMFFTGKMPFKGSTQKSALKRQASENYEAPAVSESVPEVPQKWNDAIARGLSKRVEKRFKDMLEMLDFLRSR